MGSEPQEDWFTLVGCHIEERDGETTIEYEPFYYSGDLIGRVKRVRFVGYTILPTEKMDKLRAENARLIEDKAVLERLYARALASLTELTAASNAKWKP